MHIESKQPSASRGLASLVFAAALGVAASCGHPSGKSQAQHAVALGPRIEGPFRASGRLEVCGALAQPADGGVVLRLVEQGTGRVVLQRTYDLRDPAWDRRAGCASLYWTLGDAHVFDGTEPVHEPLVLEAVELPASRPADPRPDDPRVSVAVGARTSGLELSLVSDATVAASDRAR